MGERKEDKKEKLDKSRGKHSISHKRQTSVFHTRGKHSISQNMSHLEVSKESNFFNYKTLQSVQCRMTNAGRKLASKKCLSQISFLSHSIITQHAKNQMNFVSYCFRLCKHSKFQGKLIAKPVLFILSS